MLVGGLSGMNIPSVPIIFLILANEYSFILYVNYFWISIAFGWTRFLSRALTVTFLTLFTSKHATMFWIRAIILHGINGFFFIPSVPFLVSFLQFCLQSLPLQLTHPPKLSLNHIHLYFPANHIRKENQHLSPVLHLSVEVPDINHNFFFRCVFLNEPSFCNTLHIFCCVTFLLWFFLFY